MDKLFMLIVGLIFPAILLVFVLRKVKKNKRVANFLKKWSTWAKKRNKIPLWQHSIVIISAFILSINFYLLLIAFIKPHFTLIQTNAVNWYTVHHYPAQQDKFYF